MARAKDTESCIVHDRRPLGGDGIRRREGGESQYLLFGARVGADQEGTTCGSVGGSDDLSQEGAPGRRIQERGDYAVGLRSVICQKMFTGSWPTPKDQRGGNARRASQKLQLKRDGRDKAAAVVAVTGTSLTLGLKSQSLVSPPRGKN